MRFVRLNKHTKRTEQTYRNRTESTAIVQIVCDVCVKRTIHRSLRVCTVFEVVEGVCRVPCGPIKVAVT